MLEMRVRGSDGVDGQDDPVQSALRRLPGVQGVERPAAPVTHDSEPAAAVYRLYASEGTGQLLASAASTVVAERAELVDLRLARPSLEDVFIHLTGSNLRA
jgi:ABC-2 type transport system ATP-binding protein